MSKVPCGGFKLDENFFGMNENDELSLTGGSEGEGKAYKQLVTDGTGKATWEDRLAYETDPVLTEIVPEETVAFSDMGGLMGASWPSTFNPVYGSIYTVKFDGNAYNCACTRVGKGDGIPALGNLSLAKLGEDTGEPFIMFYQSSWVFGSSDSASEHTISISEKQVSISKIDEKFLPVASDNNYGVVKKSEIVTPYVFDLYAPHDKMVEAVTAFRNGTVSIIWASNKVSDAWYDSSTDEVVISFVTNPYVIYRCRNVSGKYSYVLREKDSFSDCETKMLCLFNRDNPNIHSVISASGASADDRTVNTNAEHLSFNNIEILNKKELILYSSTVDSTKRFRITVDDSGTISATEVTS